MEASIKSYKINNLQDEIRKLMKSEVHLKAKDGKILLDRQNLKHVEMYEDRG